MLSITTNFKKETNLRETTPSSSDSNPPIDLEEVGHKLAPIRNYPSYQMIVWNSDRTVSHKLEPNPGPFYGLDNKKLPNTHKEHFFATEILNKKDCPEISLSSLPPESLSYVQFRNPEDEAVLFYTQKPLSTLLEQGSYRNIESFCRVKFASQNQKNIPRNAPSAYLFVSYIKKTQKHYDLCHLNDETAKKKLILQNMLRKTTKFETFPSCLFAFILEKFCRIWAPGKWLSDYTPEEFQRDKNLQALSFLLDVRFCERLVFMTGIYTYLLKAQSVTDPSSDTLQRLSDEEESGSETELLSDAPDEIHTPDLPGF